MTNNKDIQGHDEKKRDMTTQQQIQREERALQVTGMLRRAETLAMESRRMGEKFRMDREEHPVCPSCLNTRYVYMTCETDDGEYEEVAYLCRRSNKASVDYGEPA